jgi:hypothetical protein
VGFSLKDSLQRSSKNASSPSFSRFWVLYRKEKKNKKTKKQKENRPLFWAGKENRKKAREKDKSFGVGIEEGSGGLFQYECLQKSNIRF